MENKRYYIASEGMVYRRKSDNTIVGKYIRLNDSNDTMDNYEEVVDDRFLKIKEEKQKRKMEIKELIEKNKLETISKIREGKTKLIEEMTKRFKSKQKKTSKK